MERLTEITALGICGNNERVEHYPLYNIENDEHMAFGLINQCFEKLAEYEQAEEDGLLIRVPHPVGTEVYFAFKLQGVKKDCIRRWKCNNKGLMFYSHGSAYSVDAIGKTVFLTKAEAEQALAKMKGG